MFNENEILELARSAIKEKIIERFASSYNSPLNKCADSVFAEHEDEFKKLFRDALSQIVNSKSFKAIIYEEFTHKVAKNLVAKLEGSIEKATNELRQDPILKSKMILAIEDIINSNHPKQ